jgi:hypothetical protein
MLFVQIVWKNYLFYGKGNRMSIFKKILAPVNKTIESTQKGVEHAASEATQEVTKIVEKPVEQVVEVAKDVAKEATNVVEKATDVIQAVDEAQQKALKEAQDEVEKKAKVLYVNAAHNLRDRLLNEVPKIYDSILEALRKSTKWYVKLLLIFVDNTITKTLIIDTIRSCFSDIMDKELNA